LILLDGFSIVQPRESDTQTTVQAGNGIRTAETVCNSQRLDKRQATSIRFDHHHQKGLARISDVSVPNEYENMNVLIQSKL